MAEKKKGGRPSKYKPEFVDQAKHLCKLGAIDKDLADAFHVSEATIKTWKNLHPEFLATLSKFKEDANRKVAQSLFKRANGCSVPDSDIRVIEGEIVITPLLKHFPPDTRACEVWLFNRDPENWKPRKAADENNGGEKAKPVLIKFIVSERVNHDGS